jgi:hypothetical protein
VQRWRFRPDVIDARHVGSRFHIARRDDVIYFATVEDRHLYGVDRHTGEQVWERETPTPVYGPLPWGDDVLFYIAVPPDGTGESGFELHAIDADDKEPLWTRSGLSAPPCLDGDRVYLPLARNSIVAVDRRGGGEVWRLGPSP